MPRVIVIDHTIIQEVNHGNVHVANALKSLRTAGAELWISHEMAKTHLSSEADRRILSDLGVRDDYMYVLGRRGSHNLKWDDTVNDLGVDLRNSPTANLVLEKKGELMTMNKGLAADWAKTGGKTTPEIKFLKPMQNRTPDYGRARTLLNLKPLTINAKGQVNPQPKRFTPAPPPTILIKGKDGKMTRWVPKTDGLGKARTGTPIKVKPEHAPDPDGAARVAKHKIFLMGVDKVVHWINDHIQEKRFNERWDKLRPTVEQKLQNEPELGALVYVYYSQSGASADSALTPVNVFQDIAISYGHTRSEAIVNYSKGPQIRAAGAGKQISSEVLWFEPREDLDVRKLEIPFQIAGIATFVPGREMFVNVKFSGSAGFDDRIRSETKLKVDPGSQPYFYYLWPPRTLSYFNGKTFTVGIDQALEHPAEVVEEELKLATVPVVELDSGFNPYDATAAMVFPATNYAALLFKKAPATADHNGQLKNQRFEYIRWVKPKNMRIIRDFASEIVTSREEVSMGRNL